MLRACLSIRNKCWLHLGVDIGELLSLEQTLTRGHLNPSQRLGHTRSLGDEIILLHQLPSPPTLCNSPRAPSSPNTPPTAVAGNPDT